MKPYNSTFIRLLVLSCSVSHKSTKLEALNEDKLYFESKTDQRYINLINRVIKRLSSKTKAKTATDKLADWIIKQGRLRSKVREEPRRPVSRIDIPYNQTDDYRAIRDHNVNQAAQQFAQEVNRYEW